MLESDIVSSPIYEPSFKVREPRKVRDLDSPSNSFNVLSSSNEEKDSMVRVSPQDVENDMSPQKEEEVVIEEFLEVR